MESISKWQLKLKRSTHSIESFRFSGIIYRLHSQTSSFPNGLRIFYGLRFLFFVFLASGNVFT